MDQIRKTRDGNLLIELLKDSKLEEVSGAIQQAVWNELLIRSMVPTVTIELRDLEETTTEEEIREAFIAALVEATPDQVEVKALRAGPRGTKAVLVPNGHRTGDVTCTVPQIARGKLNHRQNENG